MTIKDLLDRADEAEATREKLGIDPAGAVVVLTLRRKVRGEKARIAPGLMARVQFWGDEQSPSIVELKVGDIRKWAAKNGIKR